MLDFLISSFNENPFDLHLGGSFTWSNSQESFMYCSDIALATHVANRMESFNGILYGIRRWGIHMPLECGILSHNIWGLRMKKSKLLINFCWVVMKV